MKPLGSLVVGPNDTELWLDGITLDADDDLLWLRVTQTSPVESWKYSFGLASFISDDGAELGTTKIFGNLYGEVFAIGVGRPPSVRTGRLRFVARHYNLRWVSTEGAPTWNLDFEYETGSSGSGLPSFGTRATLGVLADLVDAGVTYVIREGFARLALTALALPPAQLNDRRSSDSNQSG